MYLGRKPAGQEKGLMGHPEGVPGSPQKEERAFECLRRAEFDVLVDRGASSILVIIAVKEGAKPIRNRGKSASDSGQEGIFVTTLL